MPSLEGCKNPDGSMNWEKYDELRKKEREEDRAKGKICRLCGQFIIFERGYPDTCQDCKNLDKDREIQHPNSVRCPKCGHHWRVGDDDDYELYNEGTHDVTCVSCDHEFEVETHVSYSFTSPERVKEEESEEEKEEEDGEAAQ